MDYIVYMHESKTSKKQYIGYTRIGLQKRLHKHYINATAGGPTHFHKAIRKYGLCDFTSKILWEGESRQKAILMEVHYINVYDTFKTGYNQTLGGDGGWCVPDEKYDEWILKQTKLSTKENNGRWSGHSDDDILECAHDYFSRNPMNACHFIGYSAREFNMPKTYSKNRFGDNGPDSFKLKYCERYGTLMSDFVNDYAKSDEHIIKLSLANKGKRWYSNHITKKSNQFNENEQPNDEWQLGRKYGNTNRKIK